MPNVLLPFERYKETAPLPPVCIRCGAPATRTIKMMFFDANANMLSADNEEDYVVVDTPLCEGHPFMGQARWMILFGFLLLVPLCGLGALMKIWTHHYLIAFPLIALVVGSIPFIGFVWLTSIGGKGYTKKGVTVTGASRKFIDALEEREWTHEAFVAGLRRNRKGRERTGPPFWTSPYFYVPVALAVAFAVFTPIGWVAASHQTEGGWPAGYWEARNRQQAVAPPQPQPQPQLQPQPAAQPRPEPLVPQSLPGLIAYWPLDDNQGATAVEQVGRGFASLQGGQWVQGRKGSALRLDGKKEYLDLAADGRLNFTAGAPFTLAAWVGTNTEEGVICSFRARNSPFPVIDLFVKTGRLHGWVRDGTSGVGGARLAGGPVNDGQWHHVALLRHADGTAELFLDAASQARERGEHSGGAITTNLRALGSERFAVATNRVGPKYFDGIIDEFCVYNRDLSPDEIALLAGARK